jgi:hypothetical protein
VRKLLLFLLLLGAGLLLLYWFDRRSREPAAPAPAPIVPSAPGAEPEAQGLKLEGRSQVTFFDKETHQRPVLTMTSEGTRTEGGVDLLTDVTLDLMDPEQPSVVQVRLRAREARPKRVPTANPLEPRWERRVELEGVEAQVLAGLPLAPLTFRTPTAVVDVTDPLQRKVTTDDAFSARSPELVLDGQGLVCLLDQQQFDVAHAGKVVLSRGTGVPATLTAGPQGTLQVRREGTDGPLVLEVHGGAVLDPGAETPNRLEAEHLRLRARPDERDELALEELDADGQVDWTAGESHFQGQTLSATFVHGAPASQLEHARLDGAPRADLVLKLTPGVVPEVSAASARKVTVRGRDWLDITRQADGFKLMIEGPPDGVPSIEAEDFRLTTASRIDGWLSEDQRSSRFHATGGVVIQSGPATMETADFTVAIGPDKSGETVLTGTAAGGVRLESTLAGEPQAGGAPGPPRKFTLTSPDGLELERSSRGWRVTQSTHVDVALEGAEAFHARADRVRDFVVPQGASGQLDPGGLRFSADGAVEVQSTLGRLGGESLEVLALEPVPHLFVRGPENAKAYFSGAYEQVKALEGSALEIERTGDTLHLRGQVTGSADLAESDDAQPTRISYAGDELTLDRAESEELLPGERLRTLRLLVEGHVQGSVSAGKQTLVARCQRLSAENRARLVQGAPPVELGSLFIAEGRCTPTCSTRGAT